MNSRSLALTITSILLAAALYIVYIGFRKCYWFIQRMRSWFGKVKREEQNNSDASEDLPRRCDLTCPICLDGVCLSVETNCAHVFCGPCLHRCWDAGAKFRAMDCPMCRQKVSLLLASWNIDTTGESESVKKRVTEIKKWITVYNFRFSNSPRSWLQIVRETPHLLTHFWHSLTSFHHALGPDATQLIVQARIIIVLLSSLLYVISPFDIVPEGLLGILGSFDDLTLVFILATYIASLWRDQVAEQNWAN